MCVIDLIDNTIFTQEISKPAESGEIILDRVMRAWALSKKPSTAFEKEIDLFIPITSGSNLPEPIKPV